MKNIFLLGLFSAVIIAFTGCSEGTKTTQNTETKSAKCGEGKCGTDTKKEAKPTKCDASGKCGEGKCGDGSKNTP